MTNYEIDAAYIGNTPVEKIYLGTEVIYEEGPGPAPVDYRSMPLTIKALSGGTFYVNVSNNDVQVSFDSGDTWDYLSIGTTGITVSSGDELQFAGMPQSINTPSVAIGLFSNNTLAFDVYGNIESLEYGQYVDGSEKNIQSVSAFTTCFSGCTGLHSAENLILPATMLTNYCYHNMFYGCTSLTTPPELPADMLAERCYTNMFRGCTSLVSAPELPATTLTQYSYSTMFRDCTSLNYIKCLATSISSTSCFNWVQGVAATGTFVKASGMSGWSSGASGIPSGWTVQNDDGTEEPDNPGSEVEI